MYICFDIGGTNIRVTATANLGSIGEVQVLHTPQDFHAGIDALINAITQLAGTESIHMIAGGLPGIVDKANGTLAYIPHLPDWKGQPIAQMLSERFSCPVLLENDTALVGLGEAVSGAGRGIAIVGYLGLGTGMGGVRIVNEQIDASARGFEPGHQLMLALDGDYVELETMISGSGITRRTGKQPPEITDDAFWKEVAIYLAIGIHNTTAYWSPHKIILGGGLFRSGVIHLSDVHEQLQSFPKIFGELPPVESGKLGDQAGLWGGVALIAQNLHAA